MTLEKQYILPLLIVIIAIQANLCDALKCWDCNSAYDPRCGEHFDNSTLALVDCSQKQITMPNMNGKKPIVCRTITQEIEGKTRVVRGCGWLEDDSVSSCVVKIGTNHLKMTYCACTTDACNPASTLQVIPSLLGISLLLRALV